MAVVAVLQTLVQADTSAFDRNLAKSGQNVGTFRSQIDKQSAGITTAFSGLASISGLGALLGGPLGKIVAFGGTAVSVMKGLGDAGKAGFGALELAGARAFGSIGTAWSATVGKFLGGAVTIGGASSLISGALAKLSVSFVVMGASAKAAWMAALGGAGVVTGAMLVLAAAAIGTGLGLVYMSSRGAETISNLSLLSRELGLTTEAMAGLSRFGTAGPDAFAHSMIHLQRSVAEATPAISQALARINLDPSQLQALTAEQQLRRVADGFSRLTNQGDRARVAMELFGRQGIGMMDDLARGSVGIDRTMANAERFGIAFTASEAQAIRDSNRAWGQWGMAMEGIGVRAAVAFAPMWEALGNLGGRLGEWLVFAVRDMTPYIHVAIEVGKEFAAMFGRWIAAATQWIAWWQPTSQSFKETFIEIAATAIVSFRRFGDMWRVIIDAMQLKFMEFRRWIGGVILSIGESLNNLLPEALKEKLDLKITVPGFNVAELDRQIERLRETVERGRRDINADINVEMERLRNLWLIPNRQLQPQAVPVADLDKQKVFTGTETTLAGSERAFSLLYGGRSTQDYYARQTAQATERSREALDRINAAMDRAPAIMRARL
jgi:hypothetical protein